MKVKTIAGNKCIHFCYLDTSLYWCLWTSPREFADTVELVSAHTNKVDL